MSHLLATLSLILAKTSMTVPSAAIHVTFWAQVGGVGAEHGRRLGIEASTKGRC